MKTFSVLKARQGFTLIEILVVITIIAGLAAISFNVFMKMPDKARATASSATCGEIASAVNNFMSDHQGAWPVTAEPPAGKSFTTDADAPENMIAILMAKEVAPEEARINRKGVSYLSGNITDIKSDGIFQSANGALYGYYDPWGKPYYVIIDDDLNDSIPNPFDKAKREIQQKVIVFGTGSNRVGSDHDNKQLNKEATEDNVYSWKQK